MTARPQSSQAGWALFTLFVVVAILHFAQDVLMPLALAFLLSFLLAPVVSWLQRAGLHRTIAVVLTAAIGFALAGALLLVVANQFIGLVAELPSYRENLLQKIRSLPGPTGTGFERSAETIRELTDELQKSAPADASKPAVAQVQIVEPAPRAVEVFRDFLGPLVGPLGTGAIVVVFVIFMLLQREDLRDRFVRLMGAQRMHTTVQALDDAAGRVSRYLLMQTLINSIQGVLVAVGLYLLGVPEAALWGALTVALRFIPYLGPVLAAIGPIALSIAFFDNWTYPLATIALIATLELISNNVLEPWLYGSSIGVSSLGLIVATVFWTWLWGTAGLFLAAPLTVCVVVMGKYIPQLEFLGVMLSDQPVLEDKERFYQRLLADDPEEAEDLIEEASKTRSLVDICDTIVLPALRFAEQDHDRGAIDEAKRRAVVDQIAAVVDELPATHRRHHKSADEPVIVRAVPFSVLCLPASDRADEAAAQMFAALIEAEGAQARVISVTALKGEMLDAVEQTKPDAIFVSAAPPAAVIHARYLCKRLRARFDALPIVVALWDAEGDLQKATDRLTSAGADKVVGSSAAGLVELRHLLQPVIQGVRAEGAEA